MENNHTKKGKTPKERKDKYEEKVSFEGTFDELLDLTIKTRKEDKTPKATDQ